MNEDRIRFLRALGQLGFCTAGNHATTEAYEYPPRSGFGWCPDHRCPSGDADPPKSGECKVGRIHRSAIVYWLPVMGIYVCRRHYKTIVLEIIRRGEWGHR